MLAAALSRFRPWLAFAGLLIAALAPAARAEWREVSSDHFVIYANQDEDDLRRFADRLRNQGIEATVRRSRGLDINAACGQLKVEVERKRRAGVERA